MRTRPLPAYAWTCHINKGSRPVRLPGTAVRVFLSLVSHSRPIFLAWPRRSVILTSCSHFGRVNGSWPPARGVPEPFAIPPLSLHLRSANDGLEKRYRNGR